MYKCHLLGAYLNRPDCSLCQRIEPRFNCAWCAGACHHKSRCTEPSDDSCPAPRIDYIHPLSGPTHGGTKVVIEGSNLGQSFEEIADRVTIGNVPCKPIEEEYKPSNKIVCITSSVFSRYANALGKRQEFFDGGDVISGDVMVGNKAGYSIGQSKFQFKSIYLRDHQPRYGPQSGGTKITLTGMNLNIGSNIQIFLDDLPCLIELTSMTAEQIVCRTSASRHPSRAIKQLKLIIDDAQIVQDWDVFYYMQDPIITKIFPTRSYLSGGRPINVFGANLTAIQTPRMAIIDASGKKINESICILQDDSRMQCPSPAVNLMLMDLEWSEQHIGQYESQTFSQQASSTWAPIVSTQQQPSTNTIKFAPTFPGNNQQQPDESVKFRLSFIMDNVWRLRDLQGSFPGLNTEIIYTSDPKLYPFASNQYKDAQETSKLLSTASTEQQTNTITANQHQQQPQQLYQVDSDTYLLQPGEPLLILYGENLRTAVSEYEITVTVGQDLCNLTQLTPTKLVCLVPLDHMPTPTDEDGHQTSRALPLVIVRIGFNLRFELGYVQYHPLLVDQIVQYNANSSEQLSSIRPTYPQYMPRENESLLHKISNYITTTLLLLLYITLGSVLLAFIYAGFAIGYRQKQKSIIERGRRYYLSKLDSLEKSLKSECRIASMALQGDLNELVRHVELSGIPLLDSKQYIMKVFFPGINNHPLLMKQTPAAETTNLINTSRHINSLCIQEDLNYMSHQQHVNTIPRPLKANSDNPMEFFERLILTKPFLITFVNTLEKQPSFTIRDKINVGSLIIIALMDRLDYATDILRTLLNQLVEKSVNRYQSLEETIESRDYKKSKLTRRASNLLGGLPITKKGSRAAPSLGKVVGGGASGLVAGTSVVAKMLLSRVGSKTSPLQPNNQTSDYFAQNNLIESANMNHCMSTTTFNHRNAILNNAAGSGSRSLRVKSARSISGSNHQKHMSSDGNNPNHHVSSHLHMLRRTDSIVEKMLTNWLALNMYDYFHGDVGHSLYMMFEALKSQLDRGPVDAVSGDAYYSLNEHKLLREPHIQFDSVNLYVIVDTDILQPNNGGVGSSLNNDPTMKNINLLLDSSNTLPYNSYYEETTNRPASNNNYSSGGATNTITLTLRVLDCDTIGQVKGKILNALYRNLPNSYRLSINDVELSLRQQQQTMQAGHQNGNQYINLTMFDEDYTNVTSFDRSKRLNTLRHYGVNDQAIMMLNRSRKNISNAQTACQSNPRTTLTDVLDEHYNNPYSEIQYVPVGGSVGVSRFEQQSIARNQSSQHRADALVTNAHQTIGNGKPWHLIRSDDRNCVTQFPEVYSNNSSPSSHSPSMMLLGHESQNHQVTALKFNNNGHPINPQQQQQQYYHPSSSSTSSTGNVMDTNSTSANSSSMNVTNLLMKSRNEQPIYCQIDSVSGRSQRGGANSNGYYCQIGNNNNNNIADYNTSHRDGQVRGKNGIESSQEQYIYLSRMLASKGTVRNYIDDFFKTILNVKNVPINHVVDESNINTVLCGDHTGTTRRGNSILSSSFPPAVKWLFDLLDEAAMENGITNENVIHAWKSNSFLLRFWVNFIKNPNYILDVEKTNTLDASLSIVAQTLMDSCSVGEQKLNKVRIESDYKMAHNDLYTKIEQSKIKPLFVALTNKPIFFQESTCNKLLFARNIPKYRGLVKNFYQDIASMRSISDQEMMKQMGSIAMMNAGRFDTNLALKELCVYAVNYGVEIMGALNEDHNCQQLDLSQQLEQCFRSFTIFEAYR